MTTETTATETTGPPAPGGDSAERSGTHQQFILGYMAGLNYAIERVKAARAVALLIDQRADMHRLSRIERELRTVAGDFAAALTPAAPYRGATEPAPIPEPVPGPETTAAAPEAPEEPGEVIFLKDLSAMDRWRARSIMSNHGHKIAALNLSNALRAAQMGERLRIIYATGPSRGRVVKVRADRLKVALRPIKAVVQ